MLVHSIQPDISIPLRHTIIFCFVLLGFALLWLYGIVGGVVVTFIFVELLAILCLDLSLIAGRHQIDVCGNSIGLILQNSHFALIECSGRGQTKIHAEVSAILNKAKYLKKNIGNENDNNEDDKNYSTKHNRM